MKRTFFERPWPGILAIAIFLFLPHYWPIPFFSYAPVCLWLMFWLLRHQHESMAEIGFSFSRFSWKTIPIGLLLAVGWSLSYLYGIAPVLSNTFGLKEADVSAFNFIKHNPVPYLLILLAGWLIGGWYEEIIFRGFIHSRIIQLLNGKKYAFLVAAVFTSIVFGFYHIQQGASGVIHATLFSIIPSCLMYSNKGNLWYGMIFHGFYDTIGLTMIFMG